jgi:hypothetical protein
LRIRSSYVVIPALLAVILMVSSAVYASLDSGLSWGLGKSKKMTLSVFAATDRQSGESGFGASLMQNQRQPVDFSYVSLNSYRLYQISKLAPKRIGGFTLNFGFSAAYAVPVDDLQPYGTPENLYTGLTAVLAKTETSFGVAIDVRATSLAKDVNPIAWFSNPDILWLGAGLSYSF